MIIKQTLTALVGLAAGFAAQAANVYVMDSSNASTNSAVQNALTTAGHSVTIGAEWHQQDGSQSLTAYDTVVFLDNHNWSSPTMSAAGQNEILNFVSNGGGLVTSEWFVWSLGATGYFDSLAPLSPVQNTTTYNSVSSTTYSQDVVDAILNNGVSSSFSFSLNNIGGTESAFTAKPGATAYYSSSNGGGIANSDGLVGQAYGLGEVLSFSTLISSVELGNSDYRNLFVNAVEKVAGSSGGGGSVPVPAPLFLLGAGLVLIGIRRYKAA